MNVYISGPISGIAELNLSAFMEAHKALEDLGHTPVNPHIKDLPADAAWQDHMRMDIKMLMDCQGVAMLPGWENSRGAKIERQLALDLGIPVQLIEEWVK